jgi:hypothetical protein
MTWVAPLLLSLPLSADGATGGTVKAERTARTTVTAELACLHCTFGEGESCAVCLKVDEKTPVVLAGKVAGQFEKMRLTKKVVVVTGTLKLNKDKRLVLVAEGGRFFTTADKGKAPGKGQARVEGLPICGSCNLMVCDECTLAVVNGQAPIILDGKLARDHAEGARAITAEGRLFIDRRGLVRLEASKVNLVKGK